MLTNTLFFSQKTFFKLLGNQVCLNLSTSNDFPLFCRNLYVINTPCCSRVCRVTETECFDTVENRGNIFCTAESDHIVNYYSQELTSDFFVDKTIVLGKNSVEENTAYCGLEYTSIEGCIFWSLWSQYLYF